MNATEERAAEIKGINAEGKKVYALREAYQDLLSDLCTVDPDGDLTFHPELSTAYDAWSHAATGLGIRIMDADRVFRITKSELEPRTKDAITEPQI